MNPKRIVFLVISTGILAGFLLVSSENKVSAATGINRTINFQGKVVNSNGTNVADGQYTFVFRIYDVSSGGAHLWTETQNSVQVTAGVFRVALGSVTSISGVDFNTDNLYLGINFNSDGEMTPRVRFASVPYAFNAEKVAGLTVTDTTGTFTLANSKVLTVNNTLTFGGTDGTSFTLPNSSGTIVTLDASQILTSKSIGSTGLTFSGASTDILTGTNESLTIAANGTGNVLVQSQSGGQAAFVVDKTGSGDILAASASGVTKFVINNNGTASSSAGFTIDGIGSLQSTNNQTLTVGGGSTGNLVIGRTSQVVTLPGFDCSALGNGGKLTTTAGGVLTCSADVGNSSTSAFDTISGAIVPGNQTLDTLLGGTSSTSAAFRVTGQGNPFRGTQVAASVSANTSFAALVVDNKGVGDIFTASTGGVMKFTINNSGALRFSNYQTAGGIFYADGSGNFLQSTAGNNNECLKSSGGSAPTWGTCGGGSSAFDVVNGAIMPGNTTLDTLLGGTSSTSAAFRVTGNSAFRGTQVAASVSANTSFAGLVIDQKGVGDVFTASTSGVTQLVLTGGGALGLGLGNGGRPNAKFDVNGAASISGGLKFYGTNRIQSTGNQSLFIGGDTTGEVHIEDSLYLGINESLNGGLTFYSSGVGETDPTITADANGNLILSAPTGQVQIGDGTGNITISLETEADVFIADKTVALTSSYTSDDFTFQRVFTGGANNQGGSLVKILDTSGGSGTINGDLLIVNSALTSGNFIGTLGRFQQGGVDKLRIFGNGTLPVATISGQTSFAALVVDNKGLGDIFTASTGGVMKFTINNSGALRFSNYQTAGGIFYADGSGNFLQSTAGSSNECLKSSGGGAPTWGACSAGAAGTWDVNSALGIHYPGNNTLDLLIGGSSTSSAKFAILGIAGTSTPVASISATSGTNIGKGIYLSADGTIQSTNFNALTLGGSTTGELIVNENKLSIIGADPILEFRETDNVNWQYQVTGDQWIVQRSGTDKMAVDSTGNLVLKGYLTNNDDAIWRVGATAVGSELILQANNTDYLNIESNGAVGLGTTTAFHALQVARPLSFGALGTAQVLFDQYENQEIFTASASGATKFVINNKGQVGINAGNNNVNLLSTFDLRNNSVSGGTLSVASISGQTSFAALVVDNKGVGDIFTASTGGVMKFTINNSGALRFSNYQTAGGIFYADGSGNFLQSTAGSSNECLKSSGGGAPTWGACGGGSSAFDVVNGAIMPGNTTLDTLLGGTSSTSAAFRVIGNSAFRGTTSAASVSANTSFAGLVIDQKGVGDVFTASTSGVTQLVLTNGGALGLGLGNGGIPTAKLDVNGAASISSQLSFRTGAGSIQTTAGNTLTIGGTTTGDVVIRPGNTPGLTFKATGRIGLGTSNPLSTLDVRAQNGTISVASVSGATSFAGLIVDQSGVGDVFSASTSGMTRFTIKRDGSVLIGNSTDGLTFDYINGGPNYTGTARPTKSITISPEFIGAVITASGSATTNGTMTSDASASASLNRTYYEWTSTQNTVQDYVVAVRVTLPSDFSSWPTSGNAMTISLNTASTATGPNGLDVYIYNSTDDANGRPVYFSTNNVSSVAKTWTTVNLTSFNLDNNASPDWDAAGETVTIYLKLKASGTVNYTQVGDIVLNYLAKF